MALNDTHFEYADRGSTSVYKFRVKDDPAIYVWFEFRGSDGALYTTPERGPYRIDEPLQDAGIAGLDDLLKSRGTTKEQWTKDLMAQFGERIGWEYP